MEYKPGDLVKMANKDILRIILRNDHSSHSAKYINTVLSLADDVLEIRSKSDNRYTLTGNPKCKTDDGSHWLFDETMLMPYYTISNDNVAPIYGLNNY